MTQNIACLFPGQGSQSIGMLAELATKHNQVNHCFELASSVLDYDLWELTQQGPQEKLNQTEFTQAAMLTADVAVYKALNAQKELNPSFMAGHSLGEYAALVCAQALSLEDAVKLVSNRGRLMQESIPLGLGAMAAIVGLEDSKVQSICEQASDAQHQVTPANFNAIGQVVIAGHTSAVENAIGLAQQENARLATLIPVSVPCHCSLLTEAAEKFEHYLQQTEFQKPQTAVISNVDLSIHETPERIRELLKKQLFMPVRWVETINLLVSKGVNLAFEVGPGNVLSGLVKRIDRSLSCNPVFNQASLEKACELID
jgi:[acyl-carrier-protein] S-malonyltransferase